MSFIDKFEIKITAGSVYIKTHESIKNNIKTFMFFIIISYITKCAMKVIMK